jgi:tetratricopeptide (TPR) repeat protein
MMRHLGLFPLLCTIIIFDGFSRELKQTVNMWEENVIIPTYKIGLPDKNPMFFKNESYQGAKKKIYPYPFQDKLTGIKEDKNYRLLFLENDYIQISVMPEIGGRLFSALDKSNNYDFFYRQHVIKPALIGMLGAWISGGIEWCVFHHHRNTTFMPVDYALVENIDGSKTIWFGEIERRHRMKWLIGLTLFPDKSYIQAEIKLLNRTPFPHSILYWANVAVHANEFYQVIFAPSVELVTYHSKNDFTFWPISNGYYRGINYQGVDLSWWKNHPEPVSFFAWDLRENFMGGYDHGKQAGVVHIGNSSIVAGAKLWEWGPGPRGRMWDQILTDTDGPYAELMVGAYSDNQPDYSWIKPYEVKTFKQYWYPVKDIGGFKNANLSGAVNLEKISSQTYKLGFQVTSSEENATVFLKVGKEILYQEKTNLNPARPFITEVQVPIDIQETDLIAELLDNNGKLIVGYQPRSRQLPANLPKPVKSPPAPAEIENSEELFFTGYRLEQIHNPRIDPLDYYFEILKRDSLDSRTNIRIATIFNKQSRFDEAEHHLKRAIGRISADYTRPGSTEALYQLGISLRAQEKFDEAYEMFYRATWDYEFFSAAYLQLAEISCIRRNFDLALEQVEHSLSTNNQNVKAQNLRSLILRKLGKFHEAKDQVQLTLKKDPLNFWARYELALLTKFENSQSANIIFEDLYSKMRGATESYLELATDYINCGLWEEALDILQHPIQMKIQFVSTYPLIYYYLGYLYLQIKDIEKSGYYWSKAQDMPEDYCFPFRSETIKILETAIERNPKDAKAQYYLGNLLYDLQSDRAIFAWEKSRELFDSFALVHRNLGWGYYRQQQDISKAIQSYEHAIGIKTDDPRLFLELDQLYEIGNISPKKRLAVLEKNHQTVFKRNDSFTREILNLVLVGRYDESISYLENNKFFVSEGGGEIHDIFVDVHLLRGLTYFTNKAYSEALNHFLKASEYPENLSVGRPKSDPRASQVAYYTGMAYEALGGQEKAWEYYQVAADQPNPPYWSEAECFRAKSLLKLNQTAEAKKILNGIISSAMGKISSGQEIDAFAKFGEQQTAEFQKSSNHYYLGLSYLILGERRKAEQELKKSVQLNVSHLWANYFLNTLN